MGQYNAEKLVRIRLNQDRTATLYDLPDKEQRFCFNQTVVCVDHVYQCLMTFLYFQMTETDAQTSLKTSIHYGNNFFSWTSVRYYKLCNEKKPFAIPRLVSSHLS